ncbi:hypothetical protein [Aeromonas veronii]|uniref:hypothetical protein n=1 Tax=Aeromonas veronii TaxID=654 RepID=UPI002444BB25|nr:hypothetical protein [Aeromonas veronii]
MTGLIAQLQRPVLVAEQQHPEGEHGAAHQHGDIGQHVEQLTLERAFDHLAPDGTYPHQGHGNQHQIEANQHPDRHLIIGTAVAPELPDDQRTEHEEGGAADHHPHRNPAIDGDRPGHDGGKQQDEAPAGAPARRLTEETALGDQQQQHMKNQEDIANPGAIRRGGQQQTGESRLTQHGKQAGPPPDPDAGNIVVSHANDGEREETETIATQGHDHQGKNIQLEQ